MPRRQVSSSGLNPGTTLACPQECACLHRTDAHVHICNAVRSERQDEFRGEPTTSVVEADFYHAGPLLPLTDDQVRLFRAQLAAASA